MSMTIGASAAYAYAPSGASARSAAPVSPGGGGGDIVALSLAAQSTLASSSLLGTLQQTDTQLGATAASIGTDLTV
ncbi:MAG: hypothetical protein ACRYGC_04935 [Janthinobacterium lividum]